jgi:hypothetical protein
MLLFKKKDLLIVISKSGETVQFTKPLKDILKYQHRYNYKFKMYENGGVTVAEDYIINGETLTVLFGSATVTYTSEGASYTEGSGGEGESGGGVDIFGPYQAINNNNVRIAAGEKKVVLFNYFEDIDNNPVMKPVEDGLYFIQNVNIATSGSKYAIAGFGPFGLTIINNSDSELVINHGNIIVEFSSTVEFQSLGG